MSAVQHGTPGEWAKARGTVFSLWPVAACFAALGAFGTALALGWHAQWFAAALAGTLLATAALLRKGMRNIESFFKGACGEERVAALLGMLPGSVHVFNDFQAGPHHVDHLLVCAKGVFAVETKMWMHRVTVEEGKVLAGGVLPDRSPVAQANRQAEAVRAELKRLGCGEVRVKPVVCFASNTLERETFELDGTGLVNARRIAGWLEALPDVLGDGDIQRMAQLMETNR